MAQHKNEALEAMIAEHVIRILGRPGNLHRVQVRQLWEDHYRVNIMVGQDATSSKITDSYFVQSDADGRIVRSTPNVTKRY